MNVLIGSKHMNAKFMNIKFNFETFVTVKLSIRNKNLKLLVIILINIYMMKYDDM
jgi:hypothetical protein